MSQQTFCSAKFRLVAGIAFSLGILASASLADGATSGQNGTHDPSRMIESNGKFYIYSTGGGSMSSTDGLVWTGSPQKASIAIPASITSIISSNEGVWAPDIIFLNNQYYIYYAVANASNACAIGLATTPTLDPTSSAFKLTDHGVVVSNTGSATYCALDPCPILDATGNLWLSWGSGYTKSSTDNTIYVTRLDNSTGLPLAGQPTPGTPLEPGHIEASYIYYQTGFYYLFWNSGGCCSGASSTYEIHVARSQTIPGPYTGAKIFYQSTGSVHGPGQIGIYDQCGADRFTYHYYPDTGGSVLGENELSWGSDGWPVVGADSTTPLTPCGPGDAGSPDAGPSDSATSPDSYVPPTDAATTETFADTNSTTDTSSVVDTSATAVDSIATDLGSSTSTSAFDTATSAADSALGPHEDGGSSPSDVGSPSDAQPGAGATGGCGCRAGGASTASTGWTISALMALLAAFRIRRRARV